VRLAEGLTLFIGLTLMILLLNLFRAVSLEGAGPVFIVKPEEKINVELGRGFPQPGVYQFLDGTPWIDVISLTEIDLSSEQLESNLFSGFVECGRKVDLILQGAVIESFSLSWMKASKRMALGIPLDPDRMTEEDWQALPGIGEKLASKIEQYRQDNGDFGSFLSLQQVNGIGQKRLESWRRYFYGH